MSLPTNLKAFWLRPSQQLTIVVEHGEAKPGEIQAMGLGCDVASETSVQETFAAIKEKFGRIDVCRTLKSTLNARRLTYRPW